MRIELTTLFGFFGTLASYVFGGFDLLLQTLLIFIICDILTGVIGGIYNQNLNSHIMSRGIIRKMYEMLIVVIALRLDKLTGTNIFRTFACYFFIANEGLSILENVGKFIEYPDFIKKFLEQLKKSGNEGDDSSDPES